MAKRTKTGQTKHDNAVRGIADYYEQQGYRVDADIPSFDKPKKIGKFIPDVIATKGKVEKIIEVETKDSDKKDVLQHQAFLEYVENKSGRSFRKKII